MEQRIRLLLHAKSFILEQIEYNIIMVNYECTVPTIKFSL